MKSKELRIILLGRRKSLDLDDPQADLQSQKYEAPYKVTARNDIVVDDQYFFPLADPAVPQVYTSSRNRCNKRI